MKLTKTSEYALRILTFMATDEDRLFTARYLVSKLKISDKYLRRLMTDLTRAGLILSIQGRDGGYKFAKKTEEIKLADVVNVVEGMDTYSGCVLGFCNCSDDNPCAMHDNWVSVRTEFLRVFEETNLKSLDFSKITRY
jgi:Rrf2 family protein